VTFARKFRDNKEERQAEKETGGTRDAGRSRNRKSRAVETSLVQLLRGWLSSDQERTTNHALANASPRETGFRIGLARTPAIYNAPAAHKDRLLTFFNYTLFTRPTRVDAESNTCQAISDNKFRTIWARALPYRRPKIRTIIWTKTETREQDDWERGTRNF